MATACIAASLAVAAPAAGAEVVTVSPTGKLSITMRGNGHGHGMSQYGARGAAIDGKTYRQILAFYYPGTKVVTVPTGRIRVRLSNAGSTDAVAAAPDLTVTGVSGALPSKGVKAYRLMQGTGTKLWLQRMSTAAGAGWRTLRTGLPNRAEFHRTGWAPMRLLEPGGTSTAYYGFLRAVRNSSYGQAGGVTTVDRLTYNNYAAGVVPREMPASWERAAVRAQAVAARTYGLYAVQHPMSPEYDICDTSQCQVYGGKAHYNAAGHQVWTDDQSASTGTSYRVLDYKGTPIFSQFAASNGGWSVAGGQPYLKAQADPYDARPSGDPYINYSKTASVKSIAAYFGLAKVTKIAVTARDGHGMWGGRVISGYVQGTDRSGKAKTVAATGFDFAAAYGIGTTWFVCKALS
jgi:SpoIID/LytB domain protein